MQIKTLLRGKIKSYEVKFKALNYYDNLHILTIELSWQSKHYIKVDIYKVQLSLSNVNVEMLYST